MKPEQIFIGTSGWVFDDWAGTFYPLRVPRSRWLEYYAARFPIGELNSTYYRIAPAKTYAAIARRTPESFRLFAKTHADVTHARRETEQSLRQLRGALEPLVESCKLAGLLAQFPGAFHCTRENAEYVLRVRDGCGNLPLAAEFRHRSWADDETIERLRAERITWVCPDEPALPDLLPLAVNASSDLLYMRLHGRNARTWYDRRAGDRYDYNYTDAELSAIGTSLLAYEGKAERAFLLFNNCHAGKAAQNAQWLMLWLQSLSGESDNGL